MVPVNYMAVVIAAVLAMVVGFAWYSKAVFGKRWMKLVGQTDEDQKKGNMPMLFGIMFVGALVEAYILAHFIHYAGAYSLVNGVKTGVWAWLGFVATTSLANTLFEKRSMELYWVNAGYALANLMVMGAVLASMR